MKWCAWIVVWPALVSLVICEVLQADDEVTGGNDGGQPEIYIPLNGLLRLVNSKQMEKRNPFGINARGFHEDIFDHDYGSFSPMRKRSVPSEELHSRNKRSTDPKQHQKLGWSKRRPEMDSSGFHGDTFSSGFGDFWTMHQKSSVEATLVLNHTVKKSTGKLIFRCIFSVYYAYNLYEYYSYASKSKGKTSTLVIASAFMLLCAVSIIFQFFLAVGAKNADAKKVSHWLLFSKCVSFPYLLFVVGAVAYAQCWMTLIFEGTALVVLIISVALMMWYEKDIKSTAPSAPTLV
ncbi:Hypothetical predicted protein [Cloeon dipterum]|uniref:Uncharacterized protein n=1 Tax=Cloeon dipterum TaxID=197152 RepID=A0A8S1D6E3_9INSE|nr:Hypothetical predicted protein [Cloeon dipterum]